MKLAVVLFNLGGPDRQESVRPFLINLFSDPAIIGAPGPIRWALARWIAYKRTPIAQANYRILGGGSPLLPNTQAQADALQAALYSVGDVKCFIAMRYWNPRAAETIQAVKEFHPDQVVLLPLYPQYSTTTTESSFKEWTMLAAQAGLTAPTAALGCWPTAPGFIDAVAALVQEAYAAAAAGQKQPPRVLFTAHGLPKKIVAGGDPYAWQVERSAAAVAEAAGLAEDSWRVCYQSRVGPLEWIGPSTEECLTQAARDGVPIVLCPIAFVSEHSETLVELDHEYRDLAEKAGAVRFVRVPTVSAHPIFIQGLADLVRAVLNKPSGLRRGPGETACPAQFSRCRCRFTEDDV